MEDSNPQETIADLYVGFLDRCATVTLIFRIVRCLLDYHTGRTALAMHHPNRRQFLAGFVILCERPTASHHPGATRSLVPAAGLEPATFALSRRRSPSELCRCKCRIFPCADLLSSAVAHPPWLMEVIRQESYYPKMRENGIEPSFRCRK